MPPNSRAMDEALMLLAGAGTWHELRRSLQERRLDSALSSVEMQDLLTAWHRTQAGRLSDPALVRELAFWAEGGTFNTHLDGWQAIMPAALVAEAQRRGWFVRRLASGAVVNPPEGKPLAIRSLDTIAPQ